MSVQSISPTDGLIARGVAYGLLARLLGPDPSALADPATLDQLREALTVAGETATLARVETVPPFDPERVADLAGRWVTWFEQGRIAPYECSNTPPSAGGHTAVLADVAGFFGAFGFAVHLDRPDHLVAELEFAALVALAEAQARRDGDDEHAEVCAAAARTFLRDHLGRWLDAFAARVGGEETLAPWAPFAAAAADLVAADAAHRNVVPVRVMPVLPSDASLLPDEADLPECGADA